ncbi:PA2169 family four-helix-bundle protein [Henriciella aquimarina]|uniref:PA2169 family four-helix-bundle protein n=1 Tax=Henriciella aquimarina TaxID=545261 RepID=UPI0009FC8528|nr:PA2169 family four-helix-bundle protein [Henriciella aquimarina]
MKPILLATAALTLPLGLQACSSAGLSPSQEARVADSHEMSEALKTEVSSLNHLTRLYIDAAALYKQAADIPDQKNGLKPSLLAMAKDRNAQREELQDRVTTLGGQPAEHGQALGTMHRSFTTLRTVVDNDSEVAVEEVLRGERYIRDEIDKAMETAMTPETRDLLAELRTDADANIARLEGMKQAT